MLTFFTPSEESKTDVIDYRHEVLLMCANFDGSAGLGEFEDYAEWLQRVRLLAGERAEKAGFYKTIVRLAYEEKNLVGIVNVRLSDDEFICTYAGHIGYHIRPTCRGMGFGRTLAEYAVKICEKNEIYSPVICTSPDNTASQRTALSAGFVQDGCVTAENGMKILRFVRKR